MFLEATLQLVSAYPAVLTAQQAREMEHLAFDWILNADKYVAINQGDLGTIKERVRLLFYCHLRIADPAFETCG